MKKDDYLDYLDRLIKLKSIDNLDGDISGRISRLCDIIEDEIYEETTINVNQEKMTEEEILGILQRYTERVNFRHP